MCQVLAVIVLVVAAGCGKSGPDPSPVVCAGDVTITNSAEMDAFVARGCTSVTGTLSIADTDLTSVSLPVLTTVGGYVSVSYNSALATFSLPALTAVGGDLEVGSNALLTSFGLPVLTTVGGRLFASFNAALATFSLPALSTVYSLWIRNNAQLPECLALAFKDHLVVVHGFTGSWYISGNDSAATCPP